MAECQKCGVVTDMLAMGLCLQCHIRRTVEDGYRVVTENMAKQPKREMKYDESFAPKSADDRQA